MFKKVLKISAYIILCLLGFILLLALIINIPAVQSFIIHKISNGLSQRLQTEVSIDHVDFRLFNKIDLEDAYILDRQKDTLLKAGAVSIRISDLFQPKPEFNYIGLQDATINMKRSAKTGEWNYQFIMDAFSGNSSGGSGPSFNLKDIELKNIRFNKIDPWIGQDMKITLQYADINNRQLDFKDHILYISNIDLEQPAFLLTQYNGSFTDTASVDTTAAVPPGNASEDSLQWNVNDWKVAIDKININNGAFGLLNPSEKQVEKYFDPQHIGVYNINISCNNVRVIKDSIYSKVQLSAKERSGFIIRNLQANLKLSPVEMEFSNLNLITNRSHLQDYYAMHFSDFSDMSDYIHKVVMQANFADSYISSDDIAYFAPGLSDWKKSFHVNGKGHGTVNNLTGDSMDITSESGSRLQGRISLRGLPDINETFIDFQAKNLLTSGRDMIRYIPPLGELGPLDITKMKRIHFKGSFTGFIYDFVAYGSFATNLGNFKSDINMKLGTGQQAPIYSGNLSATDLDIGTLADLTGVGKTTFSAKLDGKGFQFNTLNATVDASIQKLYTNGYTYQNIKANGDFNKKLFNGQLLIDDPNISMNFLGSIDLNDTLPVFDFSAQIYKSDLRALQLTNDSLTFSGKLNLDFRGNNIDNFLGKARLYDISLFKNSKRLEFDSLLVSSQIDSINKQKLLAFEGNEINGQLIGNFNIQHLPAAFRLIMSRYYPNLVKAPSAELPEENFDFTFNFGNVSKFIQAFSNHLSGFNDSRLKGHIRTDSTLITIDAAVPDFTYDNFRFNSIHLTGNSKSSGLISQATVGEVYRNDSLLLPGAQILASVHADTTYLNLQTSAVNTLNKANISVQALSQKNNSYKVKVLNSELVLNDKSWEITPDNEVMISKDTVTVHNFSISHNEQHIILSSDETAEKPTFVVKLQELNINDFAHLAHSNVRLEGVANGLVRIEEPIGNTKASVDIKAHDFRLEDDSIGRVELKADYSKQGGLVNFSSSTMNPLHYLNIIGHVGVSAKSNELKSEIEAKNINIKFLQGFASDYISDLKGNATGHLSVSGTKASPVVNGSLKLDSVGLTVDYLGTHYTFNNETINFTDNKIDLNTIHLVDRFGNTATLTGYIAHNHLSNMNFHFILNTNKFELLNTTDQSDQPYYGQAMVNGKVNFSGPLNDMQMIITAAPVTGTHLYFPISYSQDIGKHDFIYFKTYGTEITKELSHPKDVDLHVQINTAMNNQAKIDVILDPSTGDEIHATGSGSLKIDVSLDGDFNMYGNYTIDQGSYTFTFQRLLRRDFSIEQGSTISWQGSPTNANIDVQAVYHVPGGAALYNLIAGEVGAGSLGLSDNDVALSRRTQKVDVLLHLTGALAQPNINFDIKLPEQRIAESSYAVTVLNQVKQDDNEMLNQVAGLLLAGQFLPVSSGANNTAAFKSGGISSVGKLVSSQVNAQLNNLLTKVFKDPTLGFNLDYNAYALNGQQGDFVQRNDVKVGLTKSLFNNRVRIEVGSDLDFGRTGGLNNEYYYTSGIAGDFRLEYLITLDGRVRAAAFRNSDYDIYINGTRSRTGVSLAYKREFNKLWNIFTKKEKPAIPADTNQKADATLPKNENMPSDSAGGE